MKAMSKTRELRHAIGIAHALAETIRLRREIPSGHLYATVMHTMTLEQYEQFIGILIEAAVVERTPSHLLRWVGPAANPQPYQAP